MHALTASIGHNLFTTGVPIAEKVIRTVAVYVGLVLLLRLAGKRDLAELNSFDLVVLLLLSNVVQNAVIGNDSSLSGGLLGAVVLVAVNAVVVRLVRRSDASVRLFEGNPTLLVEDGVIDQKMVRRLGMRAADIMSALHRQGANSLDEVHTAMLEPGGVIVVTLRPGSENANKSDVERLERKIDALMARLEP